MDAIGISILSGAHMTVFPKVLQLMKEKGMNDVLLTGGGIIPDDDMKKLKDSLYSLLQKPELNDTMAVNLIDKIGERQKEWELMIFHHFQKVRAICDSGQLPKFDTLVRRMITHGPWHGGNPHRNRE